MKKKSLKAAHTSSSRIGMGDFYGQGVKNPTGRIIEDTINYTPVPKTSMKKPPKSLA